MNLFRGGANSIPEESFECSFEPDMLLIDHLISSRRSQVNGIVLHQSCMKDLTTILATVHI